MKKYIPTLTIGIPAYNEAGNIGSLLGDLKVQNQSGFKIVKVIVVSDASSDDTASIAKKVRGLPLKLKINRKRGGLAHSLNYILKQAKSDLLITLDADIRLSSKNFIKTLITPILKGKADYTTSAIKEVTPKTFFATCLALSMEVKRNIYMATNGGNNLYTSFGLSRAYNKKMYTKIRFPHSVGNDMYSYLFALGHHFRFIHVSQAIVFYNLPTNIFDSTGQSFRFYQARRSMEKYFDHTLVQRSIHIPTRALLHGLTLSLPLLLRYPLHCIVYLGYMIFTAINSLHVKIEDRWDIATTSKHE